MKLSISRSQESIWIWLFWGLGTYLLLELGPFFIAEFVFKKTAGELLGPYVAFAFPCVIFLPLVWWLRKWEKQGISPKRLARGWGLSMMLFCVAVIVAVFYSGISLHLINLSDAVGGFIVSMLLGLPISYFVSYYMVLSFISTRAISRCDDA